jgi:hypothetical protein
MSNQGRIIYRVASSGERHRGSSVFSDLRLRGGVVVRTMRRSTYERALRSVAPRLGEIMASLKSTASTNRG